MFWQKPCHYCGEAIPTAGLDRVDNTKGYVLDNLVSCCTFCNAAKNTQTMDEFIVRCKKIVARAAVGFPEEEQ